MMDTPTFPIQAAYQAVEKLYVQAAIGATGTVGVTYKSPGITSFTRTGAGVFRVLLSHKWSKLLLPVCVIEEADALGMEAGLHDEDVNGATPFVDFVVRDGDSAWGDADPPDGSKLYICLDLKGHDEDLPAGAS